MKNLIKTFNRFCFFYMYILLLFSSSNSFALALNIPTNLVAFNSPQGIKIFNEASYKKDYWLLANYFITQKNQTFCSIASLVMILNASKIPKPIEKPYAPYGFFTQTNLFNTNVLKLITPAQVDKSGLTLDQAAEISKTFPLNIKAVHVSVNHNQNVQQFRATAKKILNSGNQFIMINFYRPGIHEIGGGHFSPLAAYDQTTDRFLLMDVARYKYPPVWVKTRDLWKAMYTVDSGCNKYRGYIVLSNKMK